jgi:hypothetical protein
MKNFSAMRIINTRVHGALDYFFGFLFLFAPWFFNFFSRPVKAETGVFLYIGLLTLVMSLITNYEYSMTKKLPMRVHLFIDLLSGTLLIASPWLFHFHEYVYKPHLYLGIAEVLLVILSSPVPYRRQNQASAHR